MLEEEVDEDIVGDRRPFPMTQLKNGHASALVGTKDVDLASSAGWSGADGGFRQRINYLLIKRGSVRGPSVVRAGFGRKIKCFQPCDPVFHFK